jgi:hypothetical protein
MKRLPATVVADVSISAARARFVKTFGATVHLEERFLPKGDYRGRFEIFYVSFGTVRTGS